MLVSVSLVLDVHEIGAIDDFSRNICINRHISQGTTPFSLNHCRDPTSKPRVVRSENDYGLNDSGLREVVVAVSCDGSRVPVTCMWNDQSEKVLVSRSRNRRYGSWSQGMKEGLLDLGS